MNKINSIIVHENGNLTVNGDYGVVKGDENCAYPYSEVESYLADHPEALIPEPKPREPTQEEKINIEIASINSKLNSIDQKSGRALRAICSKNATDADYAMLSKLEDEAKVLREKLTSISAII